MRNYRMLDEAEFRELERLYPTTTNRELSKMFNKSNVDNVSVATNEDYVKALMTLFAQRRS